MKTKTGKLCLHEKSWTTDDKASWGEGPWQKEPDKIQWVDRDTGLDCLIHRNHYGALCGYVGVAEGHPLFGKPYGEVEGLDVHGGLSYAAFCQDTSDESRGICHVPLDGRPHKVWWFGFACCQLEDISPRTDAALGAIRDGMDAALGSMKDVLGWEEEYRTVEYVKREVRKLAKQLHAMAA